MLQTGSRCGACAKLTTFFQCYAGPVVFQWIPLCPSPAWNWHIVRLKTMIIFQAYQEKKVFPKGKCLLSTGRSFAQTNTLRWDGIRNHLFSSRSLFHQQLCTGRKNTSQCFPTIRYLSGRKFSHTDRMLQPQRAACLFFPPTTQTRMENLPSKLLDISFPFCWLPSRWSLKMSNLMISWGCSPVFASTLDWKTGSTWTRMLLGREFSFLRSQLVVYNVEVTVGAVWA